MPESYYAQHFPHLDGRFVRTSDPAYYNCIAYAVGELNRRWWPGDYDPHWSDDYWPAMAPNEETLLAFEIALATVGYKRCLTGCHDPRYERVALYGKSDGTITHGALQQIDGTWRSKLGGDEDIEHPLDGLAGPLYGSVVAYLYRPRPGMQDFGVEPLSAIKRLLCYVRELMRSLLAALFRA
jgi:hypothetical protein